MAYCTAATSVMAGSVAEYAVVTTVTEEFFRVFAGQPSVGRSFSREEAKEGGAGAAMISDRYARQQFGEPARGLGRTLRLGNRSVSIVGVMPPAFAFPVATDVWFTAVGSRAQLPRRGNNFRAIARLKADVSVEQAHTEMTGISERPGEQYPDTNKNMRVIVTPLQREMVGDVESMLYLLLGAVALVLLIACATMATHCWPRLRHAFRNGSSRGAGRKPLDRRLMLVEASVQAAAAGTTATDCGLGHQNTGGLLPPDGLVSTGRGQWQRAPVHAALCALSAFCLTTGAAGSPRDVNEPRASAPAESRAAELHARGLVVAEIALAAVLVATGALLVRSLVALQQAPLVSAGQRALMQTARPTGSDWSVSRAFFEGVLGDISQLPTYCRRHGTAGNVESDSGHWVDRMPRSRLAPRVPPR